MAHGSGVMSLRNDRKEKHLTQTENRKSTTYQLHIRFALPRTQITKIGPGEDCFFFQDMPSVHLVTGCTQTKIKKMEIGIGESKTTHTADLLL